VMWKGRMLPGIVCGGEEEGEEPCFLQAVPDERGAGEEREGGRRTVGWVEEGTEEGGPEGGGFASSLAVEAEKEDDAGEEGEVVVGEEAFEEGIDTVCLDLVFSDEIFDDLNGSFLVGEGGEETQAFGDGRVDLLVGFSCL